MFVIPDSPACHTCLVDEAAVRGDRGVLLLRGDLTVEQFVRQQQQQRADDEQTQQQRKGSGGGPTGGGSVNPTLHSRAHSPYLSNDYRVQEVEVLADAAA